jgi:tRNA dimethylallyltransferase
MLSLRLDTVLSGTDDAVMTGCTFLLGATGVGKSAVALELARRRGAAILALDALQVYREADIGVGKPLPAERAEVPHGGLDLTNFAGKFDVAQYVAQAMDFIAEQERAGRPVLIVGGTGLYFRALTQGLCDAPPAPAALRDELNTLSTADLRARLERVDPSMIARVEAANPRRVIRAIAVMETTGRSLAAWQAETPPPPLKDFRAFWLQRPKWELDRRIAARVEAMFDAGWIGEVRGLIARYGAAKVEAFPGIGYREIAQALDAAGGGSAACLRGADPLTGNLEARAEVDSPVMPTARAIAELKRDILVATRQYAKRQLTWFRREPRLESVILPGAATVPPALDFL